MDKNHNQTNVIEVGKKFYCKKCGSRNYTLISVERFGDHPTTYILECTQCEWGLEV